MSHTNQYSKSPIAAAVSAALVAPAAALAQEEGARDVLDEIIVTARKRDENVQGIPSTVQAIPEAMLKEMGALNTEDYARFIPSVTWLNFSTAGSNQLIFRGVNTGTSNFIATTSANVYLDEISITSTTSQPDVRMMDIARVEALAGPQGTLFGASSQAGTLRIITNQPDPSQFEASVDASFRSGETSDPSHSITGVFNIPLVEDVFAIRIAAQSAKDGGFIDNVLGHTPDTHKGVTCCVGDARDANNVPLAGYNPYAYYLGPTRAEWGSLDNREVAEENWNTVDFTSVRIAARWDINDKWAATLTYSYYETEALAGNDYNPFVGDLQTIAFQKDFMNDEWDLWSLTIEADLGFAQFVSATSFLDRTFDYKIDGTLYYKYWAARNCEDRGPAGTRTGDKIWYDWDNPATGRNIYYPVYCIMPPSVNDVSQQADFIGIVQGPSWSDKFTQEFRLSHQGETFDWLAGLYYEDSNDNWDSVWMKGTTDYQDTMSLVWMEEKHGMTFPDAEYPFLSADRTNWEQTAVFGELTWHINGQWHATIGGRWFEISNDKQYLKYHAGHTAPNGFQVGGIIQPSFAPGSGGDVIAHSQISEFVPKFSLAWNVSDDKMVYASYTEGFRTGGINRSNGRADWSRTVFPQAWEPDVVANYEFGAKTRWADNTVQLNVSAFYMDWQDYQTELVDASGDKCDGTNEPNCGNPWLKVVGNVGDAHTSGVEAQLAWIPAERWEIGANAQWLEAEVDNDFETNPRNPSESTLIRKGDKLPNVPDLQGSAWATYTWPVQFIQGGEMFLRGQYSYTGDSKTILMRADDCLGVPNWNTSSRECKPNPQFTNEAFSIADVRFGLISNDGGWRLELFVNNVTDERAQVFQGSNDFEWAFGNSTDYEHYHRVFTNRPREYGLRFSSRWGD